MFVRGFDLVSRGKGLTRWDRVPAHRRTEIQAICWRRIAIFLFPFIAGEAVAAIHAFRHEYML